MFPRTAVAELAGRMGRSDALVEVWNGVPWFSPVWYRRPHLTILHHVHGPMWDQIMPPPLAGAGRFLEARLAPPFYRRSLTVTPSEATREELIELGFRPDRVTAVDNGVDPFFTPGGDRWAASDRRRRRPSGARQAVPAPRRSRRARPPRRARPAAAHRRRRSRCAPTWSGGSRSTTPRAGSTCSVNCRATRSATSTARRGSSAAPRWPRVGDCR